MTLTEIVERLDLARGAIRQIRQYVGEVDKALIADDATFEPFLSEDRLTMIAELDAEIAEYEEQCVKAMAVATPKKAKKTK